MQKKPADDLDDDIIEVEIHEVLYHIGDVALEGLFNDRLSLKSQ